MVNIIKSKLGLGRSDERTANIGGSFSNLVSGGFNKLGFLPISQAIRKCEGISRPKLKNTLKRLEKEAEHQLSIFGQDLKAHCRGYVEYAAENCGARVNGLVEELERVGMGLFLDIQERCLKQVSELGERTAKKEAQKFEKLGQIEQEGLTQFYEAQGREIEKSMKEEFEMRGKEIEMKIQAEFELRGKEEKEKIQREFMLRGELELKKKIEKEIREEFEEMKMNIINELEKRGDEEMRKKEEEFKKRRIQLANEGEEQCIKLINTACQNVIEDTESEEECEEFFFRTQDLSDNKRKRRKSLGLFNRRIH